MVVSNSTSIVRYSQSCQWSKAGLITPYLRRQSLSLRQIEQLSPQAATDLTRICLEQSVMKVVIDPVCDMSREAGSKIVEQAIKHQLYCLNEVKELIITTLTQDVQKIELMQKYSWPKGTKFSLKMIAWLSPKIARRFMNPIVGLDKLPARGGYILAANHAGWSDAFFLPMPIYNSLKRPIHFIVWNRAFSWWPLNIFLKIADCIPARGTETVDRAKEYLEKDEVVFIYPEGTMNRTAALTQIARPGMAIMALETGKPIIPLGAVGSNAVWPRGKWLPNYGKKMSVIVGEPLYFNGLKKIYDQAKQDGDKELEKEVIGIVSATVMKAIGRLIGQEYRPQIWTERFTSKSEVKEYRGYRIETIRAPYRSLRQSQKERVVEQIGEAFYEIYEKQGISKEKYYEDILPGLTIGEHFIDTEELIVVRNKENKIVGFSSGQKMKNRTFYLAGTIVLEEARGKGLATRLNYQLVKKMLGIYLPKMLLGKTITIVTRTQNPIVAGLMRKYLINTRLSGELTRLSEAERCEMSALAEELGSRLEKGTGIIRNVYPAMINSEVKSELPERLIAKNIQEIFGRLGEKDAYLIVGDLTLLKVLRVASDLAWKHYWGRKHG